jgi:hypothetical protein
LGGEPWLKPGINLHHDMGDPIAAARYAECVLAPDGTVTAVLMA